jgi:hypothetical protein
VVPETEGIPWSSIRKERCTHVYKGKARPSAASPESIAPALNERDIFVLNRKVPHFYGSRTRDINLVTSPFLVPEE